MSYTFQGSATIMYYSYSYMRVKFRFPFENFEPLKNHKTRVYVPANNLEGWIEGLVVGSDSMGGIKVKLDRTNTIKWVKREDVRMLFEKNDVACKVNDGEAVEIVSERPSCLNEATYDVRYGDGSFGKESIWNLHRPRRTMYTVGHFSPAITYAVLLLGEIHPDQAIMYIVAQIFGASLGSGFVTATVGSSNIHFLSGVSNSNALSATICLSVVLVLVTLIAFTSPWKPKNGHIPSSFEVELAPLMVGLVVMLTTICQSTTVWYVCVDVSSCFDSFRSAISRHLILSPRALSSTQWSDQFGFDHRQLFS